MEHTIKTTVRKSEGEYVVRLFLDGTHQPDANYYTDDLDDANITAGVMELKARNTVKETFADRADHAFLFSDMNDAE